MPRNDLALDRVKATVRRASKTRKKPAVVKPDPWAGKRVTKSISVREGLYDSLSFISKETDIPVSRLIERGVFTVLRKYGYIEEDD